MTTKKELEDRNHRLEETIIRVDQSLNGKAGVLDRLKEYNGKAAKALEEINQTNLKLNQTKVIAQAADRKADNNRRYMDKITIAIIGAIITAAGGVVGSVIALVMIL